MTSDTQRGEASGLKARSEEWGRTHQMQQQPEPLDPATLHGCPHCHNPVLFRREDQGILSAWCLVCRWEARIAVDGMR